MMGVGFMVNKIVLMLLVLSLGYGAQVSAGDVFKGKEVYLKECAACHGASGEGRMPGLLNFQESQALFRTNNALRDIVRDGKGIMPSFNGLLSDEDISNVVVYLRTFL